ncbi:alpha/beta hydrolase [Hellea balneolensis]|uniref:alpha/beta hydrolase n=1 Tax=Hellea balneolensis TaxID=287478 RepID=UPI00041B7E37|nr:alpha/beta hydrolase [Hellea balneolensis]
MTRKEMKTLKLILLVALTIYLIAAAAIFALQRKLLYFPPNIYLTPTAVGVQDMTEVELRLGDTGRVMGWYAPPSDPDGKVFMVFHGNGSAVYSNHDIFRDMISEGHGVWSVGYPGYPGSQGKPTQSGIVTAAIVQYDYLIAQGHTPKNIIFYGTSLGSGIAAQLAAKHKPTLLVMDAPFNSVLDMGRKQVPWLPVSLLMKDKFESDKALSGLDVPLIWIHGTADRIIPLSQGQKLYEGYDGPKSAHIIEGGQHTNLWFLGGREIVLEALREK